MHRIVGDPVKYEDAHLTTSPPPPLWRSWGLDTFWPSTIDFPSQGDGGFIGQTPPVILKSPKRMSKTFHLKKSPAPANIKKGGDKLKKSNRRRRPEDRGGLLAADGIYRLGPSLQKQWWKVKKARRNKKKSHRKPKSTKQDSNSTPTLPSISRHETSTPTSSSSILNAQQPLDRRALSSPRLQLSVSPELRKEKVSHVKTRKDPRVQKSLTLKNTTPQKREPEAVDRPFGSEVLDLDPPIMARVLDPYVMQLFSLMDPEGRGVLRKRHLVSSCRNSFRAREYLRKKAPPSLRALFRRPGFVSGIAALRTDDPTQVTFLEFRDYILGITERREAEKALEERRERKRRREERRRRKIEREEAIKDEVERQKLNAANLLAEAQKRIEKELVETSAVVAREREILKDMRIDAQKEVKESKDFANKTRVKATSAAMTIVAEGARNARSKEEAALKKDAEIRARRTRQELAMRKTTDNAKNKVLMIKIDAQKEAENIVMAAREDAEKIRKLAHEKAIDFTREIEERRKLAEDMIEKANAEAEKMKQKIKEEEKISRLKEEERAKDIRNLALEEAGGIRRRAELEAKDIKRRAEAAGEALLQQIQVEQDLHRKRVEEEKEASIRKSRADMVLVLDRAKQKSKMLLDDAEEKRKHIIEEAQLEAKRIVEEGRQRIENAEALANLKGSVRADAEARLKRIEKARADKQRLEEAALRRSRRKKSLAMAKNTSLEEKAD